LATIKWQPYGGAKDPIAASLLGDPKSDPNPTGVKWTLNNATGEWTAEVPDSKSSTPTYSLSSNKQNTNRTAVGGASSKSISISSLGTGSSNYEKQLQRQIANIISNKPVHSKPNAEVYKPQSITYQDALGQVGGSYQMRDEESLKGTAQTMADLEINPQKEALERQEQKQNLRYHNMMKQIERMYAGKDQVVSQLANKMSKQQAQDLAARGASMRSGLAEYHSANINEAVAQQLTQLEISRQSAIENLMSEHNLALEQIDGALLALEEQRGKLSSTNFEKLSRYEQELYLQQENARAEIALHIMDQFLKGEQQKLQASLAELESADRRYATEVSAWLGQLDGLIKAYSTTVDADISRKKLALDSILDKKELELDYLRTMLPYTMQTVNEQAKLDLSWAEKMGRTPYR